MKEERRGKGGFRPERNERPEKSERRERPMRTAYEVRQEPKEEVEEQVIDETDKSLKE